MPEKFKIIRQGRNRYKIIRKNEDIMDARFILEVYTGITNTRDQKKRELDALPRQKEAIELQVKDLDRRLRAIRPHLKEMKRIVALEDKQTAAKQKKEA